MFSVVHSLSLFPIKKITEHSKPTNRNQLYLRPISSLSLSSRINTSGSNSDIDLPPETLKESTDSTLNQDSSSLSMLSREITVSGSEPVNSRVEAVFDLLRTYKLIDSQFAKLLSTNPSVILADPEKDILPKLEFFKSIGVSGTVLARLFFSDPNLLTRSLENRIVPNYNFLKSILKSDKKVVSAMNKAPWIFTAPYTENLVPNIAFLGEVGVSESQIPHLLAYYPDAVAQKHWQLKEVVNEVKEMGFDPSPWAFLTALYARSGKSKRSIWNRCYAAYTKWGWSKDDIRSAYLKDPNCMLMSEKKIAKLIDFLVNKMGCRPNDLARYPLLLKFSVENRTIPRFAVMKVLLSEGLVAKDISWNSVHGISEETFLERYVTKYEKFVPELMSVYRGEVDIWESETGKGGSGIGLEGDNN